MSSLPEDIIIYDILTRLPLESLSRFRCVCKTWSSLFTNPHFSKLKQPDRYAGILMESHGEDTNICYRDYDPVSSTFSSKVAKIDYPVGYERLYTHDVCQGLICYETMNNQIIIWNPFTNIYNELPADSINKHRWVSYIFGYDARTKDYKLARMMSSGCVALGSRPWCNELGVYSSRTNKWRNTMVNIPFLYPYDKVFFNGILHWLEDHNGSGLPRAIVCFDFESETFKEIQLPQELLDHNKFSRLYLWDHEGFLYAIGCICGYQGIEAWRMKEYGVRESWTKMFSNYDKHIFGRKGTYLRLGRSLGNGVIFANGWWLYDLKKEEGKD